MTLSADSLQTAMIQRKVRLARNLVPRGLPPRVLTGGLEARLAETAMREDQGAWLQQVITKVSRQLKTLPDLERFDVSHTFIERVVIGAGQGRDPHALAKPWETRPHVRPDSLAELLLWVNDFVKSRPPSCSWVSFCSSRAARIFSPSVTAPLRRRELSRVYHREPEIVKDCYTRSFILLTCSRLISLCRAMTRVRVTSARIREVHGGN